MHKRKEQKSEEDLQMMRESEETDVKISPVRDWRSTPRVAFKQLWLWPWPWPCIGSHSILSCISHWPLSTHQMLLKSEKLFVYRRTYW